MRIFYSPVHCLSQRHNANLNRPRLSYWRHLCRPFWINNFKRPLLTFWMSKRQKQSVQLRINTAEEILHWSRNKFFLSFMHSAPSPSQTHTRGRNNLVNFVTVFSFAIWISSSFTKMAFLLEHQTRSNCSNLLWWSKSVSKSPSTSS